MRAPRVARASSASTTARPRASASPPALTRPTSGAPTPMPVIVLSNLPAEASEAAVRLLLKPYGGASRLLIVPVSHNRAFALAELSSTELAVRAIDGLNGQRIDGTHVRTHLAGAEEILLLQERAPRGGSGRPSLGTTAPAAHALAPGPAGPAGSDAIGARKHGVRYLSISHLPAETDEELVRALLEPYGEVVRLILTNNRAGGRDDGGQHVAAVEMGSESEAAAAIVGINGRMLGGAAVRLRQLTPLEISAIFPWPMGAVE
jgi:RNA recognition motif-containing protein